jgi:peroxiredoxin Q/BCP
MATDAAAVKVGSVAPDFTLESNHRSIVKLSDYRGHKQVVLYFMREFN